MIAVLDWACSTSSSYNEFSKHIQQICNCIVRIRDEGSGVEQRRQQARTHQLKTQLDLLLKKPLLPAGFSPAYPTFGGHNLSVGMSLLDSANTSSIGSYTMRS